MGEQTISSRNEGRQPFHADVQAKNAKILLSPAESFVEAHIDWLWDRQQASLGVKNLVVIASALYHPQQQPEIDVWLLNYTKEPVTTPPGKCSPEAVLWRH
ncbi:hypothetical protein EB796_024177 [Bugula neritina]|uniref:Uncharacterized protein n=1 Tax=Bugula neritina TaxID=10212 RepID=A0A7J7IVD9_BUGNE|nr:hypothetical protein EB796_024177 [Bugula neritina]